MESTEAKINQIARALAKSLSDYAYTRKDDDKKLVNYYQTQLCLVCNEVINALPLKPSE